jgi:Flp pilus assembly pilin Flp
MERPVTKLFRKLRNAPRDQNGATAIEYALIAAAIFLAIVPPMATVASNMGATYHRILSYFHDI